MNIQQMDTFEDYSFIIVLITSQAWNVRTEKGHCCVVKHLRSHFTSQCLTAFTKCVRESEQLFQL